MNFIIISYFNTKRRKVKYRLVLMYRLRMKFFKTMKIKIGINLMKFRNILKYNIK